MALRWLVVECGSFGVSLYAWCIRGKKAEPRGVRQLEPCVTNVKRWKKRSHPLDIVNCRCAPYRCRKNVWLNTESCQCARKKIAIAMRGQARGCRRECTPRLGH